MVANLQNADTESVLSFEKEEFRREYLQSFSRKNLTRIINKEELAAVDTQTMIRAKSLIDEGIKRIKRSAELLNHYFSNSDEKLTYMRRSLIPIFRSVLGLKLSKNTKELCPSWKPLSMALKAAERVILGFM
jgi:wobble nucleotide-excising tRNase